MNYSLMKMHYLLSNTPRKGRRRVLLALGGCLLVVVALNLLPLPPAYTALGRTLATPVWVVRDTYDTLRQSLAGTVSLMRENSALRSEVARLRRENVAARAWMLENERLRTLVERDRTGLVAAAILHSSAYTAYDSFVIDVGASGGIRDGMLVRTPEGHAVGVVAHARIDTSVVTTLSASRMRTEVLLDGVQVVEAQMVGIGAGTMRIEVPRDIEVAVGTAVLAPDFPGTILGYVAQVNREDEDAFQQVYVRPVDNVAGLRQVFVDIAHLWQAPLAEDRLPVVRDEIGDSHH